MVCTTTTTTAAATTTTTAIITAATTTAAAATTTITTAAAAATTSPPFSIFRHVQNSVRKRMSQIGVLRAVLLKTQIYRDVELYLTFPCTSVVYKRTAVLSA